MSKQVNGHQSNSNRDPFDFYPTESAWTKTLLEHIQFEGKISEPCAGAGDMLDVLVAGGYDVESSDICPRRSDIRRADAMSILSTDNIITNPPYGALRELLPHWMETVKNKLALLVRMNFLEAQGRLKYTSGENAPQIVIVIAGRMKVFGKVSQFPHAWVVWDRQIRHAETRLVVVRPSVK